MCEIKANSTFNGHELTDIPVLDPGDWFGKCWLLEIGVSYSPTFLVVEADSVADAIDELADHDKYGHLITVSDEDLGDYPEDERHYVASGQVLDIDWLSIHGQEGIECPFACIYHGDGLSAEGIKPTEFYCREDD